MPTTFRTPRIDVPIGKTSGGDLVYFDANFLRTFLSSLAERIGGNTAMSNTELADAISGSEAGSIIFQSAQQASCILPDIMQQACADALFSDVMQPLACSDLGEVTFQD